MNKHSKPAAPQAPKPMKVDVQNPRYEGATIEMVVKAMLQRPRKADQGGDGDDSNRIMEEPKDE